MINFTSLLTTIKSASLAAKIGFGVSVITVIAGGTAGTIAIINASQPQKEPETVASSSSTDNSLSNREDAKTEDPTTNDQKTEQTDNEQKPTTNNSQTTTPKPNNSTSSKQSNDNSSIPKPNTSVTQPNQPSQPAQPTKKPDYNLNDKYVASYVTLAFSKQDENGEWYVAEEKRFFGVTKFTGSTADLYIAVMPQYIEYAKAHGYPTDGGGMGAIGLTWDDAVRDGIALDEAKCAQYRLSCGRW